MSITKWTMICLCLAAGLAACGTRYDTKTMLPPNCAEQSALATAGTQDGRYIAITCPGGSYAAPQGYAAY